MTPAEQALARRAVACEGWRWLPGMNARYRAMACTVIGVRGSDLCLSRPEFVGDPFWEDGGWISGGAASLLPDLSDPATLGCLLAMVRAAWDDPQIHVAPLWSMNRSVGWRVWFGRDLTLYFDGHTEAEALIAALEAAPVRAGGEE